METNVLDITKNSCIPTINFAKLVVGVMLHIPTPDCTATLNKK